MRTNFDGFTFLALLSLVDAQSSVSALNLLLYLARSTVISNNYDAIVAMIDKKISEDGGVENIFEAIRQEILAQKVEAEERKAEETAKTGQVTDADKIVLLEKKVVVLERFATNLLNRVRQIYTDEAEHEANMAVDCLNQIFHSTTVVELSAIQEQLK